ncbi:MAG: HAD-IC family P-type ATPase [bacterium]
MKNKKEKKKDDIIWHSISPDSAIRELKSSKDGLDNSEAEKRLKKYGRNQLPAAKEKSRSAIFFSQFGNPLIYVLLIAAGASIVLKEYYDAIVIMIAVVINAVIGYFEEKKADDALSKIKNLIKQNVKVLRSYEKESREMEIDSADIAPGDIICLSSGDSVAADGRLIEANGLKINEASLTGEAMPVKKNIEKLRKGVNLAERCNMCYMGTNVINGNGKAVVCDSGIKTELGKIASLVNETPDEKTPLQKQIIKFSKFLSIMVLILCCFILITGLLEGIGFFEIFLTSVAIAVAAIPEGLVISMTVILSLGMQRILKKKALVKKLIAAETLGSASVICMDKTGTLTENKMVVSNIIIEHEDKNKNNHDIEKYGIKNLLKSSPSLILALEISMMCNDAVVESFGDELQKWKLYGDPTETALYIAAVQAGLNKSSLEKELPKVMEIPFNEESKYMATIHKKDEHYIAYIKGAPEVLINMAAKIKCGNNLIDITDEKRKELKSQYENLSSKGLRVLAVGYKNISEYNKDSAYEIAEIILLGFIGLKDPLRENAKETIASCIAAGIRPIIITGDHRLTAKAIIEEVGIKAEPENILEGDKLDKMSDEELQKIIKKISLYARVSPRHKLRIIDAWQALGETVAMAGDGVNDAPAIKSADIGISLGSGTDVAKETADIILIDDSFGTIVDIIDEGRVIFDNIRKVALYLLSDCFTIMILITGSLILGFPLPVLPVQILWINLVTDGFPGIAMTMEPGEIEIKKERPRGKNEPLLNSEMKILIFLIGIMTALILLGLYIWLYKNNLNLPYVRTLIFTLLGIDSLIYIFSCRSLRKPIWRINFFSNKILLIAVLFGIFMQAAAIYFLPLQRLLRTVPLGYNDWLIVLVFGIINIIAIEIGKSFFITSANLQIKYKSANLK